MSKVNHENQVLELTSEEQARLSKLANEAETQAQLNSEPVRNQTGIRVFLRNSTITGALTLLHTKVWRGTFFSGPGSPMTSTSFVGHIGPADGCKAAVVYFGKNERNQECGWLLAWEHTAIRKNKVYGQCGLRTKFDKADWNEVETQLDNAESNTDICVRDEATNTQVCARISHEDMKLAIISAFSG